MEKAYMAGKPHHLNKMEFVALKDEILALIGRGHTKKSAYEALKGEGRIEHLTYRSFLKHLKGTVPRAQRRDKLGQTTKGTHSLGKTDTNSIDLNTIWE